MANAYDSEGSAGALEAGSGVVNRMEERPNLLGDVQRLEGELAEVKAKAARDRAHFTKRMGELLAEGEKWQARARGLDEFLRTTKDASEVAAITQLAESQYRFKRLYEKACAKVGRLRLRVNERNNDGERTWRKFLGYAATEGVHMAPGEGRMKFRERAMKIISVRQGDIPR